jgi:hypothetical protein
MRQDLREGEICSFSYRCKQNCNLILHEDEDEEEEEKMKVSGEHKICCMHPSVHFIFIIIFLKKKNYNSQWIE